MGITLWLVPDTSIVRKIQQSMHIPPTISHSDCISPSSFPRFHPHITLATSSDTDALRAALPPAHEKGTIPVRFKSLEVGAKYFTAVFVTVHSPSGSPLENLREHLRAVLGDVAVPPVAHMSLHYIDDADKEKRELTAQWLRAHRVREHELGGEERVQLGYDLNTGESQSMVMGRLDSYLDGFDGVEIWTVQCEGPVEDWTVLETFPLKR